MHETSSNHSNSKPKTDMSFEKIEKAPESEGQSGLFVKLLHRPFHFGNGQTVNFSTKKRPNLSDKIAPLQVYYVIIEAARAAGKTRLLDSDAREVWMRLNIAAGYPMNLPAQARARLVGFLAESGLTASTVPNFDHKVDKIMFQFGAAVRDSVTNSAMARTLWQRALARHGTLTKLKVARESGMILNGDVPGAYSKKCSFQYIIKDNVPLVFKFPTCPDDSAVHFEVAKDCDISAVLRAGPEFSQSNLVNYQNMRIERFSGGFTTGSISPAYLLSLHAIARPVTADYAVSVVSAIKKAIAYFCQMGLVHSNIKSENIFLGSQGEIHLGDYGAAVTVGEEITSCTRAYMPQDLLYLQASRLHDNMCLVSSALCILDKLPTSVSTTSLRLNVELLESQNLKSVLLSLF